MAKSYATLQLLTDPGYLGTGLIDQGYGTTLLRMLENASEEIDGICHRRFDVIESIRYYDGSGGTLLLPDDLLSITTLELDMDGSQGYSTSLGTTEYALYPLNDYPKTRIKMTTKSTVGAFASGIKAGVKITGKFGHGDGESATPYSDSGITGTVATANGTALTLSAEGTIQQGHTIRVESEQLYVTAVSVNGDKTATVVRGVNGTTGATHSTKSIYIYKYPGAVVEATLILATGWWKQRENPATFMAGDSISGQYTITKSIEQVIESKLDDLIRRKLI